MCIITFDYLYVIFWKVFHENPFLLEIVPSILILIDYDTKYPIMWSPNIIVGILIADQYNGTYSKAQTVNHIADYEVPVPVSCSSLANIFSLTKIFPLCQVYIMVHYYYVHLCGHTRTLIGRYFSLFIISSFFEKGRYICMF